MLFTVAGPLRIHTGFLTLRRGSSSHTQVAERQGFGRCPAWLYPDAMIEVVGIADDGWDSLTQAAQQRITQTSVLIGGARHLALVPPVAGQVRHAWPSPLRSGLRPLLDDLRARHPEASVIAVASGDPLRSGVGSTLIELLGADEVTVTPALSSDTLARARWAGPRNTSTS